MLTSLRILLFTICLTFAFTAQAQTPPTKEQILEWWVPTYSNEIFSFYDEVNLIEVRLRNQEVAYICEVTFPRGRNFMFRSILIRPTIKETREILEYIYTVDHVYDLDQNGVSEIVGRAFGSGQGVTAGAQSIVQFDGWEPIVLYKSSYTENGNAWGENDYRYYAKKLDWKFVDLNGDGIIDLDETITYEEGRNKRDPVITNYRYKWIFYDNRFMRLHEYEQLTRK